MSEADAAVASAGGVVFKQEGGAGCPLHYLLLPITHGMEKGKQNAEKRLCDFTPLLAAVGEALSRSGQRVSMCPKRSQICCLYSEVGAGDSEDADGASVSAPGVYVYEVAPGQMRRPAVTSSLFSMMDGVILHCPSDKLTRSLALGEVECHMEQHLMPLLIGMGVRNITFLAPTDARRDEWELQLRGVWESYTKGHPYQMALFIVTVPQDARNDDGGQERRIDSAVVSAVENEIMLAAATPQCRLVVTEDATLPLRLAVVRRFDKIGVLVCQVLQGTLTVGDRIISVLDPTRTCSGNRVVSMRSYPHNKDIEVATPGTQVGILTEQQLRFQNIPKDQLSELPFLSLGLGDILVKYRQGPQTLPCWVVASSSKVLTEGSDVTLFGHGGSMLMRVVQCRQKQVDEKSNPPEGGRSTTPQVSIAMCQVDAFWGQGLFLETPTTSKNQPAAAAAVQPKSHYRQRYHERFATSVLAMTHGNSSARDYFPVRVRVVRHRLWVHRMLLSALVPTYLTTEAHIGCNESIRQVLQDCHIALSPPASNVSKLFTERFNDMVADEISRAVPKDLFLANLPLDVHSDIDSTTTTTSSPVASVIAGMLSPSIDLLMFVSRLPSRPLAVRVWDSLASILTSSVAVLEATYSHRRYFVLPVHRGPEPAKSNNSRSSSGTVAQILLRSVRSKFWLKHVQQVLGSGSTTLSNLTPVDQWKLLHLQEGCGFLMDVLGPSVRRGGEPTSGPSSGGEQGQVMRHKLLVEILETPEGVSAATLYAALAGVYRCDLPTPSRNWTEQQHAEQWKGERRQHTNLTLLKLLSTSKSSVVSGHLAKWILAAGVIVPHPLQDTLTKKNDGPAAILNRLTFVELEVLYMTQWALNRRHNVALPLAVLHKISHYLFLMTPTSA